MKRTLIKTTLLVGFITASITAFSQDTTKVSTSQQKEPHDSAMVAVVMKYGEWKDLRNKIILGVDSKGLTNAIISYIDKVQLMPADKPKDIPVKKKP